MKRKIARISALVGVLILAFLIYTIDPIKIWENIKKISIINFVILVLIRILYWILRTINWNVVLRAFEGKTSLYQLFIARMCGHAVSQLTPTAQVGSEATRIFMANCSSRKISIASVIVDKTIEYLTVIFFTIIGIVLLFSQIALSGKLKTFFIGGGALISFLVLFLFFKQKKGLLGWIMNLLSKIKFFSKIIDKHREKINETDIHISGFYRDHRKEFLQGFLLYSLLVMLWVSEIHLNLLYIGVKDITFMESFLVTVLGNLAFIFPFIPGSLGLYEATYIGLFVLLGRPPDVAFTLVLIRRLIALLLAGLGLLGVIKPVGNYKNNQ